MRDRLQASQQLLQQHVVRRQRHRLRQRPVQIPRRLPHPGPGLGHPPRPQRPLHPLRHVVEARPASPQQRVQVLQRARVPAHVRIGSPLLFNAQGIQARQPPDQLARLRQRERPQVVELQPSLPSLRQSEGVSAGHRQAAPPRRPQPARQQVGQLGVSQPPPPLLLVGYQVVLEVAQQQQHPPPPQQQLPQVSEAFPPLQLRV